MGDDITIGVTEIVNNIEVTAQPNDQIVDISVTDNSDDVTLNITPTVVEVNINKGGSFAKWGDLYGTLSDQTDLQNALNLKANLVGGKVPASELPSYVDDIIEVANYAALPATGEIGKIYVTLDNNKIYRWSGSVYIEIASNSAIWGAITGTLGDQTDLQNALNAKQAALSGTGFVKISGTTISYDNSTYALDSDVVKVTTDQNVRGIKTFLGNQTATTLKLILADYYNDGFITSDNGMLRLLNGTTELFNLASTGDLTASSFVKSGGTSSQYLMADGSVSTGSGGTVTSVAAITLGTTGTDLSSTVANGTTTPVITLNVPTASATNRGALSAADWTTFNSKQNALTNPVTGTGTTNYISKFTGASAIGNSSIFDNGQVNIGSTSFAGDELLMVSMNGTTNTQAINVKDRNASGNGSTFMVFRKSDDTFLGNIRRSGTSDALYIGGNSFLALGVGGNTEAIRINSSGNVGIGTSTPVTVSGYTALTINGTSGGVLYTQYSGSTAGFVSGESSFTVIGETRNLPLWFATNGTLKGGFAANGNFAIGTTTDAGYKLDVNGNGRFASNLFLKGAGTGARYLILDETNTYAGTLNIQAGGGSSGFGGSLVMWGHSSASRAGYVSAGISSGSGGKFTVMNAANGSGSDVFTVDASGAVTATGFFNSSDIRLKEVTDYDYSVSEIKPMNYYWKDKRDEKKHVGYSAQEVQKVMPDAVNEDEKGFLSVNYVEVLVAKIAELENRIKQLEK